MGVEVDEATAGRALPQELMQFRKSTGRASPSIRLTAWRWIAPASGKPMVGTGRRSGMLTSPRANAGSQGAL